MEGVSRTNCLCHLVPFLRGYVFLHIRGVPIGSEERSNLLKLHVTIFWVHQLSLPHSCCTDIQDPFCFLWDIRQNGIWHSVFDAVQYGRAHVLRQLDDCYHLHCTSETNICKQNLSSARIIPVPLTQLLCWCTRWYAPRWSCSQITCNDGMIIISRDNCCLRPGS